MDKHVTRITADLMGDLPEPPVAGDFTYGTTPDEIAADNYRRARFACRGLQSYAQLMRMAKEAPDTVIVDLLCDLMHLADCLNLDFDDLEARALRHYEPELRGVL